MHWYFHFRVSKISRCVLCLTFCYGKVLLLKVIAVTSSYDGHLKSSVLRGIWNDCKKYSELKFSIWLLCQKLLNVLLEFEKIYLYISPFCLERIKLMILFCFVCSAFYYLMYISLLMPDLCLIHLRPDSLLLQATVIFLVRDSSLTLCLVWSAFCSAVTSKSGLWI